MSTMDDLKEAFAGESQANRKYLAFAAKADEEGYAPVAKLFRAAADAETVHAHAHLRVMKGVGSTADNLNAAITGETEEFKKMYPGMIERAKGEGNDAAVESFANANAVEEIHADLYQKALDNLGKNEETDIYVCQALRQHRRGRGTGQVPHLRRPQEDVQEDRLNRRRFQRPGHPGLFSYVHVPGLPLGSVEARTRQDVRPPYAAVYASVGQTP